MANYIFRISGLLIPIGYFVCGVLTQSLADEKRVPAIYDTTVQPVINALSRFFIEIKQVADKN